MAQRVVDAAALDRERRDRRGNRCRRILCRIATSSLYEPHGRRKSPASQRGRNRLACSIDAYELQRSLLNSASSWASIGAQLLNNPALPMGYFGSGPIIASALQVFAHLYEERGKPAFNIASVEIDGDSLRGRRDRWCSRSRSARCATSSARACPPTRRELLIVAPMSGHYATLLRGTVARMVENQEVWITDWADAKMVPLEKGTFDLDDYIDYLIEFLRFVGPGTHMLAVC